MCCASRSLPVHAQPVADLVQTANADYTQVLINPVLPETGVLMQESMLGKERTLGHAQAMHTVVTVCKGRWQKFVLFYYHLQAHSARNYFPLTLNKHVCGYEIFLCNSNLRC